jgi:hypothetical protein
MSIPFKYIVTNCQDRAKYRRKSDGKITGFSIATSEEIPSMDAEASKVEWLVPHLSIEGRKRIKSVFLNDPTVEVNFDYIRRDVAEKKYLKPGESFAVPEGKKLARIALEKLPLTIEPLPNIANVDRILGFPDFQAEKPYYATKD